MKISSVQNPNFPPALDYLVVINVDAQAESFSMAIGYPALPELPQDTAHSDADTSLLRIVNGVSYAMTEAVSVSMATLRTSHSWSDHQIYVLCTQSGQATKLTMPISLYANTLNERLTPQEFAVRNQFHIVAALAVPFKSSSFDDCTLLVNLPGSKGALVVDAGPIVAEKGQGRMIDHWVTLLPGIRLTGPTSVGAGQAAPLGVQIIDASGAALPQSGVEIYFDAVYGTPSKLRAVTDTGGMCTLVCSAANLVVGDALRVKAGFKFYPGAADLTVAVQ